jgi:hypothetical protein
LNSQVYLEYAVIAALSVDGDVRTETLQLLLRMVGDESSTAEPVVLLPSASEPGTNVADCMTAEPVLFMLPGVEGAACILEPLAKNLKYRTLCLQLNFGDMGQTVHDMVQSLLPVSIF